MRLLSFVFALTVLCGASISVSAQTNEVFTSFFGLSNGNSGAQGVQWMRHALDASGSGDIVVTGFTDSTIGVPNQNPALNSGYNDWFVARYNAVGTLLWFRKIGGTQQDYGVAIITDGQGNTYVGGKSNSNLAPVNGQYFDPFIVKYDINGTQIWLKNLKFDLNTDSYTGVSQLVLDGADLYIVCTTYPQSIIVSKWNRDVTQMAWKKVITLTSNAAVTDATVDSNHNLIIVGGRLNSDIQAPTPRTPTAISQGGWDGFALGFSSTGERSMTTGQGSAGEDLTLGVTVDATNNIYVTGYVTGNYDGQLWANQGSRPDSFITKYAPITATAQGARLWSRVFYPATSVTTNVGLYLRGVRLAVDYVGGLYVSLSPQQLQNGYNDPSAMSVYQNSIFLMKFDTNGNQVWGQRLQQAAASIASMSLDSTGSVVLAGAFTGTWASQDVGQGTGVGYLMKRSNPLNCSCSDLSTLVDEVADLLQINVNV